MKVSTLYAIISLFLFLAIFGTYAEIALWRFQVKHPKANQYVMWTYGKEVLTFSTVEELK